LKTIKCLVLSIKNCHFANHGDEINSKYQQTANTWNINYPKEILTIRKSRGAPDDGDHGNCDPLPGASGGTAGTGIPTPSPIQGVVKGPKAIPWFPIDMKPGTSGSQNLAKASAPGVFGCFLEDLAQ
jgi:hypothetical protein